MKKTFLLLGALGLFLEASGQFSLAPDTYWIQFTDKDDSPYSLERPEEFLSPRSIERRQRMGIGLAEQDLPVNPAYRQAVSQAGGDIRNVSKWFNAVSVVATDPQVLERIMDLPFVVDRQWLDKPAEKAPPPAPQPLAVLPLRWRQAELEEANNYGRGLAQIEQLKGVDLHRMGFEGQGMQVAVIDAGFYKANSLDCIVGAFESDKVLGHWDFVRGGPLKFNTSTHGMQVFSTIGANKPGTFVGTAPEAQFWLLRSEDAASEFPVEEFNWTVAAEYADSVGADVVNTSLGYNDFDSGPDYTHAFLNGSSAIISIGSDWAAHKGMLMVTSAGNSGDEPWRKITSPADADSVLTVGAVGSNGAPAYFTSEGFSEDGRVKPNVSAMGLNSIVQNAYGDGVSQASGTSFSSPIMAGMVTCLWQANPDRQPMQVIKALEASANRYASPSVQLGFGIPDFLLADAFLRGMGRRTLASHPKARVSFVGASQRVEVEAAPGAPALELRLQDKNGVALRAWQEPLLPGCHQLGQWPGLEALPAGEYTLIGELDGVSFQQDFRKLR